MSTELSKPSTKIELIFEEVDVQDSEKKGFKLSWKTDGRSLAAIEGEDATAVEIFAAMSWDKIQEFLMEIENDGDGKMTVIPQKAGMN